MPRPALSEDLVQQQRDRALKVALELFLKHGVEAVSVRAIATAVGLSPMALYRYFGDGKGELLATLRGKAFEDLGTELERCVVGITDPVDQILGMTKVMVQFASRQPELYRLMFDVRQAEEGVAYLAEQRRRAWQIVSAPFTEAIQRGLLRGAPDILPHLFFAAMHGAILFELSGQPYPSRRLTRLLLPMLETLFAGAEAGPATIRKVRRELTSEGRKKSIR
jgi:AcrR family transcriptional regulator